MSEREACEVYRVVGKHPHNPPLAESQGQAIARIGGATLQHGKSVPFINRSVDSIKDAGSAENDGHPVTQERVRFPIVRVSAPQRLQDIRAVFAWLSLLQVGHSTVD